MKTDIELQRDVLDELRWETMIDSAAIGVSVEDGIVRLTGDVPSYTEQHAAERAAKHVFGVKAVANDLKVRLPGKRTRTDAAVAQMVVQALEWDTMVPHEEIQPTVSNGHVTLEGEVDWPYQKAAAERAVRNLTGITGITNRIVLRVRAKPSDVQAKIEGALRRSAELDARRIRVETHEGIVTLDGTVHSWVERDVAERAAWAAPGVTAVEDHLIVVP